MSKSKDARTRWREIIRAQASSGESVAAYCRRMRVPPSSFFAWRRKLRGGGRFAEVRIVPERAVGPGRVALGAAALEVHLPDGRCIGVRPGFDRATLLALLDALEAGGTAGAEGGA